MNLTAAVPLLYRSAALLLLAVALVGFGWLKGAEHGDAKLEAWQATVDAAGEAQKARNKAVALAGKTITNTVRAEYEKNDVRRVHGPGRVRVQLPPNDAGSCKAAPVPEAPARTDDRPADDGSGPVIDAPRPDECPALRSDAAVTTRQYLFLRDWLEQQAEAWEAGMR